ncbi:MAG: BTAD domain-containing putative transcriptional regulator, partial [Chloroflexota bacterium]
MHLLGAPLIFLNGQAVQLSSQKAQAILYYCALSPAPVARTTLLGLLWPESSEKSARSNLRTQLGLLRRELGEVLTIDRQQVGIAETAVFQVDALDLQLLPADAAPDELQRVAAAWRGDFLAGFEVGKTAEFEWWLAQTREELRFQMVHVLTRLVEWADSAQEHESHLLAARRWVTLAPLQEAAHRAVMAAQLAQGNRTAALEQFEVCRALLEAELGVEPLPETAALAAQARQAVVAAADEPEQGNMAKVGENGRLALLNRIKSFWLDGVLAKNAPPKQQLSLRWEAQPDLVQHPWADVLGATDLAPSWQTAASLSDLFAQAERALLIVGEPGAGKTITLLQLTRELYHQAQQDNNAPLPLVLNLASWANRRDALDEWILQELRSKYQIPAQLGKQWLEAGQLTLLLDGLDEVAPAAQAACIAAINAWRESHLHSGIVVCCRQAVYERLNAQLQLVGAVRLLPLTREQIDRYLAADGGRGRLRAKLLRENKSPLHELARSPLLLNLLGQVGEKSVGDEAGLIAAFVAQVWRRKPLTVSKRERLAHHLRWLAAQMKQQQQTIFLLEELQPSWLAQAKHRYLYLLLSRLSIGLLSGSAAGLFGWLLLQNAPELSLRSVETIGRFFQIPPLGASLATFMVLGCFMALVGSGLDFWLWEQYGKTAVFPIKERLWKS